MVVVSNGVQMSLPQAFELRTCSLPCLVRWSEASSVFSSCLGRCGSERGDGAVGNGTRGGDAVFQTTLRWNLVYRPLTGPDAPSRSW